MEKLEKIIMKIDWNWFWSNLRDELIFGFVFFGLILFFWKSLKDIYFAIKITKIISIHNSPTRLHRKGAHARDRFIMIFESKKPLQSNQRLIFGPGEGGGVFTEKYVDEGILQHHGLVEITYDSKGLYVEAKRDRFTRWVYKLSKFIENRENKKVTAFINDKSGKYRKISS
ncbi:MAG: hypothetical protein KBD29_04645 [Candidatus Magasanikbacteria bacterium]|nr:hypothetical protein [Candidatus Magasanikbacteria bacterium]